MNLCHLFLLLQAANVCPMVFVGVTFAHGSRGVLRVCRLAIVPPTIHRHLAGDTFSAELSAAGAKSDGTASWILGRHFGPAATPPAGRFWNRLGRGSFDRLCAWGSCRKGYTIFCADRFGLRGNGPIYGPQKFLLFRVIALAARRSGAKKSTHPIVPRPRAIEPYCPTN